MLIKFQSEGAAAFEMLKDNAVALIQLMGQADRTEGSISGPAIAEALAKLESRLKNMDNSGDNSDDEDKPVGLSARAFPLIAMLKHAQENDTYLMWSCV